MIVYGELIDFAPAGLTSYTIPNGVTWIGDGAFYGCSNLRIITLPVSVASIGQEEFMGCKSLAEVYCMSKTPPVLAGDVFKVSYEYVKSALSKIYVPMQSVDAYKTAKYWSDYAYLIEGYDFSK